ncbi:hypothetical protein [Carnobacterium funditum]|uniref:hypothetical protein n=1 Tax=Carnobacterium funditum TaxID=2752 RepID=UPI000558FA4E|nr:hypothetical protein [Carnobacterium funditum]
MKSIGNDYNDRKMAKWQGFVLSDHTEMMQQWNHNKTKLNLPKEKQTQEAISEHLYQAFLTKKQIILQMEFLLNGLYENDLIGIIVGQEENKTYLQTHSELLTIDSTLIRHAEIGKSKKW